MLSAAEISLQFRLGTGEQTPKNFQNVYIFMFDALFDGVFVKIIPRDPALLSP